MSTFVIQKFLKEFMTEIRKTTLNKATYGTTFEKYKTNKRYKILNSETSKFTIQEKNKYYYPKIIAGIFLTIFSIGIAPLLFKPVRNLFHRRVKAFECKANSIALSVSKTHSIISNHDNKKTQMLNLLEELKNHALSITSSYLKDETLLNIAQSQAAYSVDEAKITVLLIINKNLRDQALYTILKEEVKINPNQARETALLVSGRDTALALEVILEIEVLNDLDAVFNTAMQPNTDFVYLTAAAKAIAYHDFEKAKAITLTILDEQVRCMTLVEIIKIKARDDWQVAKEIIPLICNPYFQFMGLLEIARADPTHDLKEAKKSATELPFFPEGRIQIEFAKIDPKHDLKFYIKSIENPFEKVEFLIELKRQNINYDFNEVYDFTTNKNILQNIDNPIAKNNCLFEIVKTEAYFNLEDAKVTAQAIEIPQFKAKAEFEIAKKERNPNFDKAKNILISMGEEFDSFNDGFLLKDIVKAEAEIDLDKAKNNIHSFGEYFKPWAIMGISNFAKNF